MPNFWHAGDVIFAHFIYPGALSNVHKHGHFRIILFFSCRLNLFPTPSGLSGPYLCSREDNKATCVMTRPFWAPCRWRRSGALPLSVTGHTLTEAEKPLTSLQLASTISARVTNVSRVYGDAALIRQSGASLPLSLQFICSRLRVAATPFPRTRKLWRESRFAFPMRLAMSPA